MVICPVCDTAPMRWQYSLPGDPLRSTAAEDVDLYLCEKCAYSMIVPEPDAASVARACDERFFATRQQDVPLDEDGRLRAAASRSPIFRNARARVRKLRRRKPGGRLLDIGCGKGMFVQLALEHYEAEGIDASPFAVEWGTQRGLPLRCARFPEDDVALGEVDIVTMWDSLSCFARPQPVFAKVAATLAPQGLFVLTVANRSMPVSRLLGRYWPMIVPPISVAFHSRRSLTSLAERVGLQMTSFSHEGKWVDVSFAIEKIRRHFGVSKRPRKPGSTPRAKAHRNVYVNLWDIATAEFEKV